MKVSVITPTLNSASTIRDTIESVIAQDYPHIEHIVVDGGSSDGTMEIIHRYTDKISYLISEPDRGIYDAMNKGIEVSSGYIIGILNSDDSFAAHDVISRIVSMFQNDESVDGVYSNLVYVRFDNPEKISRRWNPGSFKKNSFLKGWHPPHPTLYLRKSVYEDFGTFNLEFHLAADFELMLRFFEKHTIKTKYIDYTTVRMRKGGVTNKNWTNIRKQNLECIKAFELNGFQAPKLYPVYRLFPKFLQYLKR